MKERLFIHFCRKCTLLTHSTKEVGKKERTKGRMCEEAGNKGIESYCDSVSLIHAGLCSSIVGECGSLYQQSMPRCSAPTQQPYGTLTSPLRSFLFHVFTFYRGRQSGHLE